MDFIDISVISAALLYIAFMFVEMATDCAQHVWDRTKVELDFIDLFEAVHVPATSNTEAIIIVVGATIRTFLRFPLWLYKSITMTTAPRIDKRYSTDRKASAKDILGSVSTMLSGYPERAQELFQLEHVARFEHLFASEKEDYDALQLPNN